MKMKNHEIHSRLWKRVDDKVWEGNHKVINHNDHGARIYDRTAAVVRNPMLFRYDACGEEL